MTIVATFVMDDNDDDVGFLLRSFCLLDLGEFLGDDDGELVPVLMKVISPPTFPGRSILFLSF